MNVDDIIRERIEAARRKIAARKKDRASFAAARSHGLARRHAAKLRHLAERRAAADADPKVMTVGSSGDGHDGPVHDKPRAATDARPQDMEKAPGASTPEAFDLPHPQSPEP